MSAELYFKWPTTYFKKNTVLKMKKLLSKVLQWELFSLTPLLRKKIRCPYPLCLMRYVGGEVPKSNMFLFSRKQHIFSKNIIRKKIFYVKFSIKMGSTKLFSTLTVTKLQSFMCGVSENIWCIPSTIHMWTDNTDRSLKPNIALCNLWKNVPSILM